MSEILTITRALGVAERRVLVAAFIVNILVVFLVSEVKVFEH